jgi:uncharacterized protein YqkB
MADEKGSIDDKALSESKRMNRVELCKKNGIFYNPEKRSCDVSYPCEFRVEIVRGWSTHYTCKLHNPEPNPEAKPV